MSRALLIVSAAITLSSCAAPEAQRSVRVPPLRWEPHVAFTRHESDFVGWIGLRVGDRTYRLIEHPRSSCGALERSRYSWYDIPPDAITAAVGWYAGGGEQFYVVVSGSSLIVYHRTEEEGGGIPPYRILMHILLPRTTSNHAMERTADRRESLFSMIAISHSQATLALDSGRSSCSR